MGQMISLTKVRAQRRREQRLWLTLRYLRAFDEHDDATACAILLIALGDRELRELIVLAEQAPSMFDK